MTPIEKERALILACEQLQAKVGALSDTLREIANQDPVELVLDPQWAARIARIALTSCGMSVLP